MWWFFSLIMTSTYTANLAAFLTMERMGVTINSAEDLAKQTKIKYGTVEGGATQAFFRETDFPVYQRMWTQMVQARPSVFEKDNADGVKRVKNTKNQLYSFLMESSSIEYEMEKNCNLRQVGSLLDTKSYGIAMPMSTYDLTVSLSNSGAQFKCLSLVKSQLLSSTLENGYILGHICLNISTSQYSRISKQSSC